MLQNIFGPTISKRPQVLTAEKKTLTLALPFLGELSHQTRIKLQKVLKRTLSCAKIQIVFKNQINFSNVFHLQALENKVGQGHLHFSINF